MIAILPAAGKGTRMMAVTGGKPKELLKVGERTVLQSVLDEASLEGEPMPTRIVWDSAKGNLKLPKTAELREQKVGTGLAAGILNAFEPDEVSLASLVLLPDVLYIPNSPSPRLIEAIASGADIAIATAQVSNAEVSKYGVMEWVAGTNRLLRVLEKPPLTTTFSRWCIASRYAFSAEAMQYMRDLFRKVVSSETETSITPIINSAIYAGFRAVAVPVLATEKRYDCGSPEGYAAAVKAVECA